MAAAIVGRSEDLERVEALLDGVEPGVHALILDGEAGIGKTTVWRAGVETARTRKLTLL
jgi:Mg-chelatase subunit ChlI